eukprot:GSChrysophyteH1.ASY1.ANO1.3080.1 assembled CDS
MSLSGALKEHIFSVAPQMDITDVHQRYFFRLLSKKAVLYTEMVTDMALVHTKDPEKLLRGGHDTGIVLQLGGSDPKLMAEAARIAMPFGFKRFNLNCGCPSPKVAGAGQFGVSLMRKPELVRDICDSISNVTGVPTSVKCRIGIDELDSYDFLADFVGTVASGGSVNHFQVHARKALLGKRFSAADNRKIPPLRYDRVHRLATDFSDIGFTLNGGLRSVDSCAKELRRSCNLTTATDSTMALLEHGSAQGDGSPLVGCMVGRACIENPFSFSQLDSKFYGAIDSNLSRGAILEKYAAYAAETEKIYGLRCRRALIKPVLNLFYGQANGKIFRTRVDELARQNSELSISYVLLKAAECLEAQVLQSTPTETK